MRNIHIASYRSRQTPLHLASIQGHLHAVGTLHVCVCCVCCVCACMDEHVADVPEQRTSPYVVNALSPRSRSAPPSRRELLQHIHK